MTKPEAYFNRLFSKPPPFVEKVQGIQVSQGFV